MAGSKSSGRGIDFWLTLLLIVISFLIVMAFYYRIFFPNFFIGPFRDLHWLGWIGALRIAIYIPIFHLPENRMPKKA